MIRLTTFLAFLMLGLSVVGQRQMIVRDMQALPNDQTANMYGSMKKDQNGEVAALVKVRSTIDNLHFDGGVSGIVAVERIPGEYWVYVPAKSRKLFIRHHEYGLLEVEYSPIRILAAKTYSMNITIDGKEVSIETSVPRTELILDNDTIGTSPQTVFLPYGLHTLQARNGNMVFDGNIEVKRNDDTRILIDLRDEREDWSVIKFKTDPEALLFFNGEQVGLDGEWEKLLAPGEYEIESRDRFGEADPQITQFEVTARNPMTVEVTPPVPHVGYLNLEVSPVNATVTEGSDTLAANGDHKFPIGRHVLTFEMPGYYTLTKEYRVEHNIRENSSIKLKRIQFAKSSTLYAGVGGSYVSGNGMGLTVIGGFLSKNLDMSLSYTMGLTKSDPVEWYNTELDTKYQATYKQ